MFDATASDARHAAFGEAFHGVLAVFDYALGDGPGWGVGEHEVNMNVPETWEKPTATSINDCAAIGIDRSAIGLDAGNHAILNGHAGVGLGMVGNGID